MAKHTLTDLMETLGYSFEDTKLLTVALTHRSQNKILSKSRTSHITINYERLEFLGDSVLGMVMAKYLYNNYPDKQEGQLTRMRATLVREETLVKVAKQLSLGKYLILGAGEIKAGGRKRDSILADVVEAIIGAIYKDCNDIAVLEKLIISWFSPHISDIDNLKNITKLKDNKSQLQELLQAKKLPLPAYELLQVKGKAPKEVFYVQCSVVNKQEELEQQAVAEGKSRRIAEQNAAKMILDKWQA